MDEMKLESNLQAKNDKPKHAGGRPTKYCKELSDLICDRVATHKISTTKLCLMYDDMPHVDTVVQWRWKHPEFSEAYRKAKCNQIELLSEELEELSKEKLFYTDAEGNERVDTGSVASTRLQVETRKFLAVKLLPKIFGDKVQLTHNGTLNNAVAEVNAITTQKSHDKDY